MSAGDPADPDPADPDPADPDPSDPDPTDPDPALHDPRALRDRLTEISARLAFEVTTRPMMGGFMAYADGRVFVSLSHGGLGIKLTPPDQERALARPGAHRLRHRADMPESRTYIALSADDLADDEVLAEWLTRAAATAQPRPPRPSRSQHS